MPSHQDNPTPSATSTFRTRIVGRHARMDQLFPHPDLGYTGKHEGDQWTILDAYHAGVSDGHMEEAYDRDSAEPRCDLHPGGCPTILDSGVGPLEIVTNLPPKISLTGELSVSDKPLQGKITGLDHGYFAKFFQPVPQGARLG